MNAYPALVPELPTQIISWGSLYQAFVVLVEPVQAEFGWGIQVVTDAFISALVTWGFSSRPVGRLMDMPRGRFVMIVGANIVL